MSTFRHVLFLRFTEDATEAQIQALYDGLAGMPSAIAEIQRYEFGPDIGHLDGQYDMALVADFSSREDWQRYSDHPDHRAMSDRCVKPIAGALARVQYLID